MDAATKLELLADNSSLEPTEERRIDPAQLAPCGHSPAELPPSPTGSAPQAGGFARVGGEGSLKTKQDSLGIHHAAMPGGKTIALLKTMLTSIVPI